MKPPAEDVDASGKSAFAYQMLFTLMHELGHVFNLQHTNQEECFLDTSPAGDLPPPIRAFRFLDRQMAWMSAVEVDRRVRPGGTGFASFDFAGALDASSPENETGLQLSVGLSRHEFFRWEPVELEVVVERPGHNGEFELPDQVDPGYGGFVIWIEDSNGERRRYRPTKHYCGAESTIRIPAGQFFRRDISIFGESGGLTFPYPGRYRIWVTFQLHGDGMLCSNKASVTILDEYLSSKRARRRVAELRRLVSACSRVLFYRQVVPTPTEREALARKRSHPFLAASANYALGRSYGHVATMPGRKRHHWTDLAKTRLAKAAEAENLNAHQRWRASQCHDFLVAEAASKSQ